MSRRMSWRDYVGLVPSAAAVINGFIAVLIAQFFRDSRRARVVLVVAAGALGVAAIGATFYSQNLLAVAQGAEASRRHAIREQLGAFIAQGDALMSLCTDAKKPAPQADADAWGATTEMFLRGNLGDSYVTRFRDQTGVPPVSLSGPDIDTAHQNLWFGIYYRVARLQQFSQEVPF